MNDQQPEYLACAVCRRPFDAINQLALIEDESAFCERCAYEISMVEAPTSL